MPIWFFILSQFSILAFALIGGVFLAFSDFIMRSLATASSPGGIEVMQVINREVFRWVFMSLFIGMAGVSVVVAGYAYFALQGPAAWMILAAAALYLFGVFGVTALCNVPLNNQLETMDITKADAIEFWTTRYLPDWTFWNTVRTAACVLAAGTYLWGLVWLVQANG